MFIYLTLSGLTLKIKFFIYEFEDIDFVIEKNPPVFTFQLHLKITLPFFISYFAQQVGPIFYTRRLSLTQTFIKHLQFCHFRILSSLHFTIKFPLFVIKSICTKVSYISLSDKKNSTPSRQSFLFYTQHMQEYNVT